MIPSLKPAELQTQAINPARVMRDVTRLLVETIVQPDDLPDLELGEEITARMAQDLGNGRFAALIKNRPFTLDFPGQQKPQGEFLKLRVHSLDPKLMFALVDGLGPESSKDMAIRVLLSATSRYLSDLLLRGKYEKPLPTDALVQDPGAHLDPKRLGQALQQMISRTGTHYEAHLKAWYEGKKSLEELRMQPQALLAARLSQQRAALDPADARAAMAELGGILQKQMDILQHKMLFLNMMPWPNQTMEFRVEEDDSDETAEQQEEAAARPWLSRMRLELPHLGTLAVSIRHWQGNTEVRFLIEQQTTLSTIKTHQNQLLRQFNAAGLNLYQIGVDHA